jgi:thiol:disulfide interchange protein DsbD
VALAASIAACVASASVGAQPRGERSPVAVTLVSERDALVPGTTSLIALDFRIDPGWHTYADSQNDTGSPASVQWAAEGVTVGPLAWPAGERYVQAGDILDHVYKGAVLVTAAVDVPAELAIGSTVTIAGSLEWLVCDEDLCVPGFGEVSITLPVRGQNAPTEHAPRFESARGSFGTLLTGSKAEPVRVEWDGRTLVATAEGRLAFIPGSGCAPIADLLASGQGDGRLRLEVPHKSGDQVPIVGWIVTGDGPQLRRWIVRTRIGEPLGLLQSSGAEG